MRQARLSTFLLAVSLTAHSDEVGRVRCGGNAGRDWAAGLSVRQPASLGDKPFAWLELENDGATERIVCLPPRVVTTVAGADLDVIGTGSDEAFGPHSCTGQLVGWLVRPSAHVSTLLLLDSNTRTGVLRVSMSASELAGSPPREGGVIECELSESLEKSAEFNRTFMPRAGPESLELVVRRAKKGASGQGSSMWVELHNRGDVPVAACIESLVFRSGRAASGGLPALTLGYNDRCPDEQTVLVEAHGVVAALAWLPVTANVGETHRAGAVDARIAVLDEWLQQRTLVNVSATVP